MESEISGGTNQAMSSFVRLVGGVAAEVAIVVGGPVGRRRGGCRATDNCESVSQMAVADRRRRRGSGVGDGQGAMPGRRRR